ncbi:MAG: hypothetical protein U5L98_18375 [Halomonas sp.]|nr:hypothetical protein [Halomonas sp.]MDZ7854539.1 hypothetical protein [Halomonas sp.]
MGEVDQYRELVTGDNQEVVRIDLIVRDPGLMQLLPRKSTGTDRDPQPLLPVQFTTLDVAAQRPSVVIRKHDRRAAFRFDEVQCPGNSGNSPVRAAPRIRAPGAHGILAAVTALQRLMTTGPSRLMVQTWPWCRRVRVRLPVSETIGMSLSQFAGKDIANTMGGENEAWVGGTIAEFASQAPHQHIYRTIVRGPSRSWMASMS